MKKKIKEEPIRLDFNTSTRLLEPVYEISPSGSEVRTGAGWVNNGRPDVITQRATRGQGFMSDGQVQWAIESERQMMKTNRYKGLGCWITARAYPLKAWLADGKQEMV